MNEDLKKNNRLLLFDIAGTLLTFRSDLRAERFSKLTKLSTDEINQRLFSDPDSPGIMFDLGEIISSDFFKRCCEILGAEPSEEFSAKFRHAYADIFEERTDMTELVTSLSETHELWLMSNTNVWHLDYCRLNYPFFSLFSRSCSSLDTGFVKPEPEIFQAALERSGRPAGDLVFIDDRAVNVEAAQKQGLCGIQFVSAADLSERLAALGKSVTA